MAMVVDAEDAVGDDGAVGMVEEYLVVKGLLAQESKASVMKLVGRTGGSGPKIVD